MSDDDRPDIDEIREREQAATGNNWATHRGDIFAAEDVWVTGDFVSEEDDEFIRHVRGDVRSLCSEVERLRGVIQRATDAWESPDDVQEILESALEADDEQ